MIEPEHPKNTLKKELNKHLNTSIRKAAKILNMSNLTLMKCLNGQSKITPYIAIKLEQHGIKTAIYWINLQKHYDKYTKFLINNNLPTFQHPKQTKNTPKKYLNA